MQVPEKPKKRIRKSRGKGLRTTSGCLTCRKRHKKCDESHPVCGPCSISSRDCVYAAIGSGSRPSNPSPRPDTSSAGGSVSAISPLQTHSHPQRPQSHPESLRGLLLDHPSSPVGTTTTPTTTTSSSNHLHQQQQQQQQHQQHHRPTASQTPTSITSPLQQQQQQGQQLPSPLPTAYEVGFPPYPSNASPFPPAAVAAAAAIQQVPPPQCQPLARLGDPNSEQLHLQQQYAYSPDTVASELLTADLASTRWFDLLATDAAQADKGFSLAPTRHPTPVVQTADDVNAVHSALQTDSQQAASLSGTTIVGSLSGVGARTAGQIGDSPVGTAATAAAEQYPWQLDTDLTLQNHEIYLFKNFVEHAALWLDLFHPERHFSTHATRLALRNLGLMKAILALTSRHAIANQPADDKADVNVPVQYYYETLQYVQDALQYTSYTRSEELLATVIIISTYEMLDDSNNSNWKRHLKGVFWIQRSQDVNGASGGLRQAVWWAWLRQDLWAAFREKRACFSFWRPLKDVSELSQNELANRAVYLLSQAVNYRAHSESATMNMADKISSGERIMAALDQWQIYLGPEYRPLPTATTPMDDSVFKPIWIHPPQYAVAVQAYHFAKILITLHRPAVAGFHGYLQTQRILSDAVDAICGIAMELKDEGCQMLSAECLFGAGLCTQDPKSRDTIIALIRSCEARTGWPMTNLIEDLRAEWASFS